MLWGAGWAYSGYYFYEILKACSNELAAKHIPQVQPREDTLAGPEGRRADTVRVPPSAGTGTRATIALSHGKRSTFLLCGRPTTQRFGHDRLQEDAASRSTMPGLLGLHAEGVRRQWAACISGVSGWVLCAGRCASADDQSGPEAGGPSVAGVLAQIQGGPRGEVSS